VIILVIRTCSLKDVDGLSKTSYKVLVTHYYPFYIKGLKGKINEWLPSLAPSKELLNEYREEVKKFKTEQPKKACELAWNIVSYDSRFRRQILNNPLSISELKRIRDIGRQLRGKRMVYLICHERTDDYCHRRILQELMEKYEV